MKDYDLKAFGKFQPKKTLKFHLELNFKKIQEKKHGKVLA